jgi:glycosyltransferase involved in cell wall biosynthesis
MKKRKDLIFVGAGSVPTNLAAVSWFITEVWLSLLDSLPNLKFYIIGQWNIKGMIKRKMQSDNFLNVLKCSIMRYNNTFCKKYEGIMFAGKVSDRDLEKYLGDCRLFVSPIQFTTGVNTKNVLALETGIPLITTLNGSNGLVYKVNCLKYFITRSNYESYI